MPLFPDCSFGPPARVLAAAALVGCVSIGTAQAQTQPQAPAQTQATPTQAAPAQAAPTQAGPTQAAPAQAATTQAAPTQATADPLLAEVDDQQIHLSDLKAAAATLPAQARTMPPQQLYPVLLEQLVDAQALVVDAKKSGLDKDPDVQRAMRMADERTLASAYLNKEVRPQVTEEAVKARYDQEYGDKKGETEVHARHILVPDEATAKKIIGDLQHGGDFAALSKQYSKDPGAAQQGGDLGFFKKSDMVPAFADVAFALKDNEVSPVPVKTQFGWHVIQTLGRRTAEPPSFEQKRDQIRQQLVQAGVQKAVAQARQSVTVKQFNMDGSPVKATDTAAPPTAH